MSFIERRTTPSRSAQYPGRKLTYAAFVYERHEMGPHGKSLYDVEIVLRNPDVEPKPGATRECVYGLIITSHKNIIISQLVKYMEAKFKNVQRKASAASRIRGNTAKFMCIAASLEWIKSIIQVEFDYHVGERQCRHNKEYLDDYISSRFNGYGPTFYQENIRADVNPALFEKLFG